MSPTTQRNSDAVWQKFILPEEERRNQPSPPPWNGSYRWFRSSNIVDLWHYRSATTKQRIIEHMWRQQVGGRRL